VGAFAAREDTRPTGGGGLGGWGEPSSRPVPPRTRTQPEGRYSYSICNPHPITTQAFIPSSRSTSTSTLVEGPGRRSTHSPLLVTQGWGETLVLFAAREDTRPTGGGGPRHLRRMDGRQHRAPVMFATLFLILLACVASVVALVLLVVLLRWYARRPRNAGYGDRGFPMDRSSSMSSTDSSDVVLPPPLMPSAESDDDSLLRRGALGHDTLHPSTHHSHVAPTDPGTCADPATSSSDSSSWSDSSPSCGGSDSGGGGSSGSSD
jgi:hypothetical protein